MSMTSRERAVYDAFKSSKWDYRTVFYVAQAVGFEQEVVNHIITSSKLYRKSLMPMRNGYELYALRSRVSFFRDFWNTFRQLNHDKLSS